ncbi:BamA/TamA family outer membrane protein [Candidatus Latescibacterota bacterium]
MTEVFMKRFFIFFTLFFFSGMTISHSSGEESDSSSGRQTFFGLPVLTYSTDTGVGAGVAAVKTYNPDRERISYVQMAFLYTQKKQIINSWKWDHYFPENIGRIIFKCDYSKFPTYFFGMGNNTSNSDPEKYTPEYFITRFYYERGLKKQFRIRTQVYFYSQSLLKSEPGGQIHLSNVPWSRGRRDAGTGIAFLWDSRDNIIATNDGLLMQVEYEGSLYQNKGHAYNLLTLDLRKFFNPFPDIVLGSMVRVKDCRGNVPFYSLAMLGGQDLLRGYEYDRFRDRSAFLFQQDIRYPIWGVLGGAVFIATGCVDDKVSKLFSGTFHTAYGAGLRFIINKEDNLIVRFDYAVGSDSTGYYITFGEAF